jgi:hypothetical protein
VIFLKKYLQRKSDVHQIIYPRDFDKLVEKHKSTNDQLYFYLKTRYEFGPFLHRAIPWIYGLYENGLNIKLISCYPKEFVFFAADDTGTKRAGENVRQYILSFEDFEDYFLKKELTYTLKYWIPPPYQKYYENKEFVFNKPLLVIQNKYNGEPAKYHTLHGKRINRPVNYIPLDLLEKLIRRYRDKYQIIYNRCDFHCAAFDHTANKPLKFRDFTLIKSKYRDVIIMQDLIKSKGCNYNTTQLKVYANCKRFIGVQGGGSVICYYFGGKSLTLHIMPDNLYEEVIRGDRYYKGTTEITPKINYYTTVYPKLSNQVIVYARNLKTYGDLALKMF